MDIKITINTDNAAFHEDGYGVSEEVARILKELANEIGSYGIDDKSLRDINGNTVGHLTT